MVVDRHAEVFRAVYDTLVEPTPATLDWAELEARATEAPSLPIRRPGRLERMPVLAQRWAWVVSAAVVAFILVGGVVLFLTRGGEEAPPVITRPPDTTLLPTPSTSVPSPTITPSTLTVPDGPMNWQQANVPTFLPDSSGDLEFQQRINRVIAGGPGLLAVGASRVEGDTGLEPDGWVAAIWQSQDGLDWSRLPHVDAVFGNSDVFYEITDITAGGPGYVAVGHVLTREGYDLTSFAEGVLLGGLTSDYQDAAVWVSENGVSWARVDSPSFGGPGSQLMTGVAAGEAGIVAVGDSEDGSGAWVSDDGNTWQRVEPDPLADGWVLEVVEDRGGFVAVGGIGLRPTIWTSADGVAWAPRPVTEVGDLSLGFVKSATRLVDGLLGIGFSAPDLGLNERTGSIWISGDDGATWIPFTEFSSGTDATDLIGLVSTAEGLVVAGTISGPDASHVAIWISVDEGTTWRKSPMFRTDSATTVPNRPAPTT